MQGRATPSPMLLPPAAVPGLTRAGNPSGAARLTRVWGAQTLLWLVAAPPGAGWDPARERKGPPGKGCPGRVSGLAGCREDGRRGHVYTLLRVCPSLGAGSVGVYRKVCSWPQMTGPRESPPDRQVPPRQPPWLRSGARRSPPGGPVLGLWLGYEICKYQNVFWDFADLCQKEPEKRFFLRLSGRWDLLWAWRETSWHSPAPPAVSRGPCASLHPAPGVRRPPRASPPLPGSLWLWTLTLAGDRLPGPVTLCLFSWCIRFTSAGSWVRARVWPGVPAPVCLHPVHIRQGSWGCAPPLRFLQK